MKKISRNFFSHNNFIFLLLSNSYVPRIHSMMFCWRGAYTIWKIYDTLSHYRDGTKKNKTYKKAKKKKKVEKKMKRIETEAKIKSQWYGLFGQFLHALKHVYSINVWFFKQIYLHKKLLKIDNNMKIARKMITFTEYSLKIYWKFPVVSPSSFWFLWAIISLEPIYFFFIV